MKVVVNWGPRNARRTYRVRANNLEQALAVLQGREEWGLFEGSAPYRARIRDRTVISVELSPTFSIQMPKWLGYRGQPQPCQDEWDRMWRALMDHERGHADLFEASVQKIVSHLEEQASMTRPDLDAYMAGQERQTQDASDSYDRATDHGASRGVELRIVPECRSRN